MSLGDVRVYMFSIFLLAIRLRPSLIAPRLCRSLGLRNVQGDRILLESLKERMRKLGHQCCTSSRTEDCRENTCRSCFAQQMLDNCPVSRCAVIRQRGGGDFDVCLKVVCLDQLQHTYKGIRTFCELTPHPPQEIIRRVPALATVAHPRYISPQTPDDNS